MTEANNKPRTVLFNDDEIQNSDIIDSGMDADTNHKWESLNLKPNLVKGIYNVGFESPSFIQKKSIPIIAEGKDLRAQSQSGTGKTGAFVIGALQNMDENLQAPQILVLASTREIAAQNYKKFTEIGVYMKVTACLLSGGRPVKADTDLLRMNPQIIVGTPGRINHMMESCLVTSQIKIFILDEADEMLKAGFEEQVRSIYVGIKAPSFQTLLFSATYSVEDIKVIGQMVRDPVVIDLRHEEQTLKGIKQYVVDIGENSAKSNAQSEKDNETRYKVHTLIDIFKKQVLSQVMIFINKKSSASLVHKILNEEGFPCELISSDFTQEERERTLEQFKSGKTRILVSSGLCKRGIDVQALSVVVCLDVPRLDEMNDYIHRVGRSGRYGRKGIALHILSSVEVDTLNKIAENFHSVISTLPENFSFKE